MVLLSPVGVITASTLVKTFSQYMLAAPPFVSGIESYYILITLVLLSLLFVSKKNNVKKIWSVTQKLFLLLIDLNERALF